MKVRFETINPDKNSSFRVLHIAVPTKQLRWEYHYHPEMELVCVLSGSGSRHVGYSKSNYMNGDLVLIGPNLPHSGFGLNSIDPHEEIVVQFREEIITLPTYIEEMNTIKRLISNSKFGVLFSNETKEIITPKLQELKNIDGASRYLLLLEILIELANDTKYELLSKETMPHSIVDKNRERLETIFTFIENNFQKEIDVKDVAEMTNLTLPAFSNFFKKATKITFTDFVNQYRIDKACSLILQGKNISESCYNVGYNNLSYFNRTFKKYMGKTPTEFTKEILK